VGDPDDPQRGEITLMENLTKAARLVEALLEAGFEKERIRVFSGSEEHVHVTYRPVVSFLGVDGGTTPAANAVDDEAGTVEGKTAAERTS
jgi:hypothetical protein